MIAERWREPDEKRVTCQSPRKYCTRNEQGPLSWPLLQIVRLKLGSRSVYGSHVARLPPLGGSGRSREAVSELSYVQAKL
jgi:hypothetical protein